MATRLGLISHTSLLGLLALVLASILASCTTAPVSGPSLHAAYSTVLPIYVSPNDTESTKQQVYRANSLHEGVTGGAKSSP